MEKNIRNLIVTFIAPPGGGKGTIAEQAIQSFGFNVISTGNLCRMHKEKDTAIGQQMRECLAQGKLVPDTIISAMVKEWLIEHATGKPIILDGYPRSLTQAQELLDMLNTYATAYTFLVIELVIPTEIIVQRLSSRMICSEKSCQRPYTVTQDQQEPQYCQACKAPLMRRADDVPQVIRERINVYLQGSSLIKEFFATQKIPVKKIEVSYESPDEVFELFKKIILNYV